MKNFTYSSDDILAIVKDVFPDFDFLFENKPKGDLIVLTTPCGQPIPFVWKFPVITDGITDYVIYEHISGRVYNYVGMPSEETILDGFVYEDEFVVLKTIKEGNEIAVLETIKKRH